MQNHHVITGLNYIIYIGLHKNNPLTTFSIVSTAGYNPLGNASSKPINFLKWQNA